MFVGVFAGAIINNSSSTSMVNVLSSSAVVSSSGVLAGVGASGADFDYRNSQGGVSGCGGVASYSNVTSPSAYTSPSEEDEVMDGATDMISSDNEDISDINRSLIQSGHFEKTSSGQNSGNATPGGTVDYYQQMNHLANGLQGDLPTMVYKGEIDQTTSNDVNTISSDSFRFRFLTYCILLLLF